MSPGELKDVVRHWWIKTEESIASANRELNAGSYTYAINRIYYAAFYGVCTALLERNLSFKKHSSVRASFHREFIKTGLMKAEWSKFYDRLFEDRQEGDYVALVSFKREHVEEQLNRCKEFLKELQPLISSLH